SHYCPLEILSNIVKAICTFAEETQVSNQGMIELSNSNISFIKIQDITYVLVHGLAKKKEADILIKKVSEVFESKSRAKFHSDDPKQVFSGASSVFSTTVNEIFSDVIEVQSKLVKENEFESKSTGKEFEDFELISVPIQFDELELITLPKKEKSDKKKDQAKQKGDSEDKINQMSQKQKLQAVTYNILNTIDGIEHLVFVSHKNNKANLFFENGKISTNLVDKTLQICEKFLEEIVRLMNNDESENAIDVTETYQIIFVPLDEQNFMYAIAKKIVDPVLLQPVFERIAKRIKDVVLNYKK
ncbi:MAG: hypothetical protein ACTSSG_14295, partial [Candidatus Heimdallarchaeaceae archaeon]